MGATLFQIMSIGQESLSNSRVGVNITGHNIANAQTEGYSRQRVNLENKEPIQDRGLHVLGTGARVQGIERAHDKFLETQIRRQTESVGSQEAVAAGLGKLEGLFNPELTTTLRDRFNTFNSALRDLSNYPEESAVRIHLVNSGTALAQTISSTHAHVVDIQDEATREINSNLSFLNDKLKNIATLNQKIKEMEGGITGESGDLQDKRDIDMKAIAALTNINTYKDENNQVVIRGPGGALLVEGSLSAEFALTDRTTSSEPRILVRDFNRGGARDVTHSFESGKIAGIVQVRDKHAQEVRSSLNSLASGFASEFNAVHNKGYGMGIYAESTGRDFFTGTDLADTEAAAAIDVNTGIQNDTNMISVALTPRAPGDNVVANELIELSYKKFLEGGKTTFTGFYDNMVGKLGIDSMHAREDLAASQIVMTQLQSQRESVAGVSLDEEAANLLKYQHLFTASSRLITTVDQMFQTVLDLKR